jgi:hypothetical protein
MVIAEHLRERRYENIHAPAAQIHDLDLGHHHALARRGYYRCEKASLTIRVPATHPADAQSNGVTEYLRALTSEGFFRTLKFAATHRALRGVIDRLAAHQAEAWQQALSVTNREILAAPVTPDESRPWPRSETTTLALGHPGPGQCPSNAPLATR